MNDLITALAKTGGPILGTLIGGPVGTIAGAAIGALAEAFGTPATPEAVKEAIETRPDAPAIVRQVEADKAPELQAQQTAIYQSLINQEAERGWFYSAWRPAGMWLVLVAWGFAILLAPVLKLSLPMQDLVAFTGLYLTLLMGGHTAKEWFNAHYAGRK